MQTHPTYLDGCQDMIFNQGITLACVHHNRPMKIPLLIKSGLFAIICYQRNKLDVPYSTKLPSMPILINQ